MCFCAGAGDLGTVRLIADTILTGIVTTKCRAGNMAF